MNKIDDSEPNKREIWHPFHILEEAKSSMWKHSNNRQELLNRAIEFTGDYELYGEWMMKVIDEWPLSCEHNLTKPGDKRPWIGHAACALAIDCPEDIVRQAWSYLSDEQQFMANKKAEEAINYWRSKNA